MSETPQSHKPTKSNPIEYLVIGHLTEDVNDSGTTLGGTAAFSGLTANALGFKTGVITSCGPSLDTRRINPLWIKTIPSMKSTQFENISDGKHRQQLLYEIAEPIKQEDIPTFDPQPAVVHLGPVANEVDPDILQLFPNSLKCLTPQGWFRTVDDQHHVILQPWYDVEKYLQQADLAVISLDDVERDEKRIAHMAAVIPIFVVTENYRGARIYWHSDARFIKAPEVKYVDDTGAGDIFAAAFFYRYFHTRDPWEAGRFAVLLASWSVTRKHLDAIPEEEEIRTAKMELIN